MKYERRSSSAEQSSLFRNGQAEEIAGFAVKTNLASELASIFTRMTPFRFTGELRACELCGGTDHDVVGRRDRYGNRLRTVLCRGCGLVFTNPMPTEEEVDRFYSRYYRMHYHGTYTPTRKAILKARRGAAGRYETLMPVLRGDMRILDIGSSSGECVHFLRERGFDAVGIEPNEVFAAYSRVQYGIPVYCGGWQDADISEKSIDLVTINHVLEHLRHPLGALNRINDWLTPHGYLHLSVPNIENPDRTPYGRFHFAHLYNFNHATLIMMARKVGFEAVSGDGTDLILRKLTAPDRDWLLFPDNHDRLARFFATYTNRRHFLSVTPYRRWRDRMWRLGSVLAQSMVGPAVGSKDGSKKG